MTNTTPTPRHRSVFTTRRRTAAGLVAFTLALLQLLAFGSPSWAAKAGEPDTSFGQVGTVTADAGGGLDDRARALVVQPDGKVVVVGSSAGDFLLMRYKLDGTLDAAFGGGDGIVTTDVEGAIDVATAVALDRQGRIVVAGFAQVDDGGEEFVVARYNPDGQLSAGPTLTSIEPADFEVRVSRAYAVGVQANGKVVAAGGTCRFNQHGERVQSFALVRYLPDLSPDTTFSADGTPDGIITTAAGTPPDRCFAGRPHLDLNLVNAMTLVDGAGAAVPINSSPAVADSAIVVAGSKGSHLAVARYTDQGFLDPAYGESEAARGQIQQTNLEGVATGLAIGPGGKVLVSGYTLSGPQDFVALRYNADGTVDTGFGEDGTARVNLAGNDFGRALALGPDGSATIAGESAGAFALARLDPQGRLDPDFGEAGIVRTQIRDESSARGVAVAGCKIVAGGYARNVGQPGDVAVARYLAGGAPTVSELMPTQGPSTGGTKVTVKGECLDAGTAVSFGDKAATALKASADGKSLEATTPAQAPGTVPVTATSVTSDSSPAAEAPLFTFTGETPAGPEGEEGDDGEDSGDGTGGKKDTSGPEQQAAPPDGTKTAPSPELSPSPDPQVAPSEVTAASPSPSLNASPSSVQAPSLSATPQAAPTPSQAPGAASTAVPAPPPATAGTGAAAPTPVSMPAPPSPAGLPVANQAPAPAPLPNGVREDLPGASAAPAGGTGTPVSPGGADAGQFDMVAHQTDPAVVFAFGTAGIMALGGLLVVCFGADSAVARRRTSPRPQPQHA